jgi:hypothetical protein
MILSVWDREKLANESGVDDSGGWGGYSSTTRFASGAGSRSSAHELMQ